VDAPILIATHWDLEFHVHSNASNLVMGAMLAHNIMINAINQLIMFFDSLTEQTKLYM
jgi:hypothetical protein